MSADIIAFAVTAFISVIAIMNPLSTTGLFITLTKGEGKAQKHRIAIKTSKTSFFILIFFAITGFLVFQIYSITLEAFRIAGGIVLLVIGMQMMFPSQEKEGRHSFGSQIYLIPLSIPMSAGPGAITTVIVLASQTIDFWHQLVLWVAILFACSVNFFVLRSSDVINRKLGAHGITALVKIMGLLVCAVAVQFMIDGLKATFGVLA